MNHTVSPEEAKLLINTTSFYLPPQENLRQDARLDAAQAKMYEGQLYSIVAKPGTKAEMLKKPVNGTEKTVFTGVATPGQIQELIDGIEIPTTRPVKMPPISVSPDKPAVLDIGPEKVIRLPDMSEEEDIAEPESPVIEVSLPVLEEAPAPAPAKAKDLRWWYAAGGMLAALIAVALIVFIVKSLR